MRSKRFYNPCPLCGHPAKIKYSVQFTENTKEIYLACTNNECCHTYVVAQTFQRSISVPVTPPRKHQMTGQVHLI